LLFLPQPIYLIPAENYSQVFFSGGFDQRIASLRRG
jgi:hypothetical protein